MWLIKFSFLYFSYTCIYLLLVRVQNINLIIYFEIGMKLKLIIIYMYGNVFFNGINKTFHQETNICVYFFIFNIKYFF